MYREIDPFELYQGYVDKVKPVDYQFQVMTYEDEIISLKQQVKEAHAQINQINEASMNFMQTEKTLKARISQLQQEL